MFKRYVAMMLGLVLVLSLSMPTMAADADEQTRAADRMVELGIYKGDQNGNLNLDQGLSRAELAALLTRIRGDEGLVTGNPSAYAAKCLFTDVPDWAKTYVGYCADNSLMNGYSTTQFGPGDPVTPGQACTVILRHLQYPETDWSYLTATVKAASVGLVPDSGMEGATITRGNMAIIISRALEMEAGAVIVPATPEPIGGVQHVSGVTVSDGTGFISDTPLTFRLVDGKDYAREDFSQAANPAIFTGEYTRGMYNALYQSYIDRDAIWPSNEDNRKNPFYSYACFVAPSIETRDNLRAILLDISRDYYFYTGAESYAAELYKYPSYSIVTVEKQEYAISQATETVITQGASMSIKDAITLFTQHVRSRITYDAKRGAGVEQVFSDGAPVQGACGTYAYAFQYLCDRVGITCITVAGDNHAWNMVCLDGAWYHCDPTNNRILVETIKYNPYKPLDVMFAQEILAPSSTK